MDNASSSDESLLNLLKKGNRIAFNSLYERYWEQLFQSAIKVLQDEDLAKDVVQDVFVDLWSRRELVQIEKVSGYLFQAVKYQVFKQLRKVKDFSVLDETFENVLQANSTEEELDVNELQKNLNRSLESLPEKYRLIYELSRVDHLSNKEIAEKLQLSPRTVDWYLHNVLKQLRSALAYPEILLLIIVPFFN